VIKTDPRSLMITKGVIGLTRQHQNLQTTQGETTGQILQKLTCRRKVRRKELADNRQPCMLLLLTTPLPTQTKNLRT
jgi:hypothetical protein